MDKRLEAVEIWLRTMISKSGWYPQDSDNKNLTYFNDKITYGDMFKLYWTVFSKPRDGTHEE